MVKTANVINFFIFTFITSMLRICGILVTTGQLLHQVDQKALPTHKTQDNYEK